MVPITHSPPGPSQDHVELTPDECRVAGLDGLPHWVVVREVNAFLWPGFDLREIPGRGRCDYGRLPPATMKRVIAAILALRSKGLPMSRTNRD